MVVRDSVAPNLDDRHSARRSLVNVAAHLLAVIMVMDRKVADVMADMVMGIMVMGIMVMGIMVMGIMEKTTSVAARDITGMVAAKAIKVADRVVTMASLNMDIAGMVTINVVMVRKAVDVMADMVMDTNIVADLGETTRTIAADLVRKVDLGRTVLVTDLNTVPALVAHMDTVPHLNVVPKADRPLTDHVPMVLARTDLPEAVLDRMDHDRMDLDQVDRVRNVRLPKKTQPIR